MSPAKKIKWSLEADFYQACNCDYGCPCEFEAPPTQGHCDGIGVWKIKKGVYGKLDLSGLGLGFAAHWPQAIHKGNGTAVVLVDEKANPKQREALLNIASGQAGGAPFEIVAMTFSKVLDPQFVPFKFDVRGKRGSVRVGEAIRVAYEPIKNPITGAEESVRIEHATGFIFQKAECVSAQECRVSVGELNFSCPNKNGFLSKVKYNN